MKADGKLRAYFEKKDGQTSLILVGDGFIAGTLIIPPGRRA
jgi:hypothetical protein